MHTTTMNVLSLETLEMTTFSMKRSESVREKVGEQLTKNGDFRTFENTCSSTQKKCSSNIKARSESQPRVQA